MRHEHDLTEEAEAATGAYTCAAQPTTTTDCRVSSMAEF